MLQEEKVWEVFQMIGKKGEMANKLETYIDDAKEENDKGIEKAAELVTELGTQIDRINKKISFLNNSIDYKRSLI